MSDTNGDGAVPPGPQVDMGKVMEILQARFPRELELCMWQAYSQQLQEELEDERTRTQPKAKSNAVA